MNRTPPADANFAPDELDDLRTDIESMRAKPERFMELRGLALQLLDDLSGAYSRLDTAYARLDSALEEK